MLKLVADVPVPLGEVTAIFPDVAPAGTLVISWVAVWEEITALVPLNVTAVAV
jgi:hypothetical protein